MKSNTLLNYYFSAYSLKVIGTDTNSELKVNKPKSELYVNHLRVLPNPDNSIIKKTGNQIMPDSDSILYTDDLNFFNNYE